MVEGLRAAKRAATQRELARVAFAAVAQQGLTAVTIHEIAARAGVSRRTFFNYFGCKEEAVAAWLGVQVDVALTQWEPAGDGSALDLVRHLMAHNLDAGIVESLLRLSRMAQRDEALGPYVRDAQWAMWQRVAERAVAVAADRDEEWAVSVQLAVGALFAVVSGWLAAPAPPEREPDPVALRERLDRVIGMLARGLETPSAAVG
ncbi:TetR/AcrR family transcriptional regulator [Luteococcus sp. OSA5]|uniref:TetR/AcrR family transcriptional regulator n=1 Tax=Luteococcus sp. OSA5 TaxID=3401630 RepID=UPI003B430C44